MIVGSCFPGDIHTHVMLIQEDMYGVCLGKLFDSAARRYKYAESVLMSATVPGVLAPPRVNFDHRVLQAAHDLIAARFRFLHSEELHPVLPVNPELTETGRIQIMWLKFCEAEVERLVECSDFARAVVLAVAYENTKRGYEAEDTLRNFLEVQYGSMRAQ